MRTDDKVVVAKGLHSVLVAGCGLIGTSFALALKKHVDLSIAGFDRTALHVQIASDMGALDETLLKLPEDRHFDLAILAVPNEAAQLLLPKVASLATYIVDVCSVKQPICQLAEGLGLKSRFVPAHPMAGRASGGPGEATAELFRNEPWIFIDNWPRPTFIDSVLSLFGARVLEFPSAQAHDEAMAAVSHGVHLTSLSAMLAFEDAAVGQEDLWSQATGPGFRDITRLAGSPPGFWVDTLLANRTAVAGQLDLIIKQLSEVREALVTHDGEAVYGFLSAANAAHRRWSDWKASN